MLLGRQFRIATSTRRALAGCRILKCRSIDRLVVCGCCKSPAGSARAYDREWRRASRGATVTIGRKGKHSPRQYRRAPSKSKSRWRLHSCSGWIRASGLWRRMSGQLSTFHCGRPPVVKLTRIVIDPMILPADSAFQTTVCQDESRCGGEESTVSTGYVSCASKG